MQPLIEVRDLRFAYDDGTLALAGVDFQLFPGETVAVFGANGSGKTTFVLHLNGLLIGQGTVMVCGTTVRRENLAAVRQKIGLVFQDSDNQLFMPTVLEDVAFGLLTSGMDREQAETRAREALAETGMLHKETRAPWHLSAGEKKRTAIAGILAMTPKLLVLDEPTTFLDPPGQRELVQLLARLPQAKIIITHDVQFARLLTQEAAFFQDGVIAARGHVDDIAAHFGW